MVKGYKSHWTKTYTRISLKDILSPKEYAWLIKQVKEAHKRQKSAKA